MKIGSPKNLNGKDLITGISAIDSNGNVIGSDVVAIKRGENVTMVSEESGVVVINALRTDTSDKMAIDSYVGSTATGVVNSATNATNAINDKNGKDIATTYQTVIDGTHPLSGSYVSGAVSSATTAGNVKDSVIKFQLNGSAVDSFTLNQAASKVINLSGVAMASGLGAYATALDLTMDTTSYVLSAVLKNGTTVLTSKTIDLPLETMVVDADYDSASKSIKLILKNGTSTTFGVSDLIAGLVPETRKVNGNALSADVTLTGSDIKVNGSANAVTVESRLSQLVTSIGNMGDMKTADYVNASGTGVVRSAANATTVNGLTVSTAVPANAKFTDTIPGSAVIKISAGGTSIGSFTVNETTSKSINIPAATSTAYGVVKVEQVVSGTTNAVANKVVSAVSSTMNAHIASTALHVPAFTTANNGQVLKISGGVAKWDTDLTADGSAVLPNYNSTNAGQVLKVNAAGNGTEWSTGATGNMNTADYVDASGTGIVRSAGHATSATSATSATNAASATSAVNASSAISAGNATTVNGLTVSTAVPANAKFTDTIPGSAVIKISAGGTSIGSFTVNETSSKSINIPAATSTAYGVVKVVTAMANTTTDAAAISVVSAISSAMSAHMASASIHHAVDSALDGNSTNPVQNKAIVTALNGKQPSLPSGTTGQYLQKTANGVQWADVATGGDYLVTDNLANAALNQPIFFLAHSSTNVPGPVEWGLCNRQYFLYSGEDADNGITDTGKLEQGHTYVHSMIGNATFEPLTGSAWTVTRSDLDAPNKAYANPGTWYEQYYFATSNESTLISVQVRYTEAYSWADIKYNDVTERYKLTRNGTNGYYETNVVPAGEIVRATGTVNHYGTNDYNSIELVMSAVPDTAPHPPYYSQSHWMGRFWNGSGWDSPMTEPLLQNDSWISFESAVAEIGGEIVATGSQNGGYEFIRTERHAGQVIDAMYIDITPATSGGSTTPTTEGVVTVDSGSSASSISVAVVNELPTNPQSGVLYFVPTTAIQNLDTSDGISASIVTSLPSSPNADTLYFVTGSN